MSLGLLFDNLAQYSLQIGLLIGLAAFVPGALRLRLPGARLVYWQLLLAACLALPLVGPWRAPAGIVTFRDTVVSLHSAPAGVIAAAPRFSQAEIALAILAVGILARLAWLGVGFWRLRRYRRHSVPLACDAGWSAPLAWGVEADLRVSEDIASPVTFGLLKPVVLLPANFHEMPQSVQEAILAHECLHVRRKDWVFAFSEQVIRALFWFHPAIWWLLGEIELAREQAVDRGAVEITKGREEYVDALLAVAGAPPALDLAPAPLFLRKRRLKHRVVAIMKEGAMSKRRAASALAAALCIMAVGCWIATAAFPLVAAPRPIIVRTFGPAEAAPPVLPAPTAHEAALAPRLRPAPPALTQPAASTFRASAPAVRQQPSEPQPSSTGLGGMLGGVLGAVPAPDNGDPSRAPSEAPQRIRVGGNVALASVIMQVPPQYSILARQARIQDHVILHAIIGTDGTVQDLKVVSGHPLLRQSAMDAVRQWRYKPTMLNGNPVEVETEIDVNFTLQQ